MATNTTSNPRLETPFDVRGAFERWTEATRKAAGDSLDLYEKTVDQLADTEVKTARAVNLPGLVKVAEAHAAVSRELAGAYVSTARELLKA